MRMEERGLIVPLGTCDVMLLRSWRCWLGHHWEVYDDSPGYPRRRCTRCNKHMLYTLVNGGLGKAWTWITIPRCAERTNCSSTPKTNNMEDAKTLDGQIRQKAIKQFEKTVEAWAREVHNGGLYRNEETKLEKNPGRAEGEPAKYYDIGELLDAIVETRMRVTGKAVAQSAVDRFLADFNELRNRVDNIEEY